jgi:hypothetical protein
MSGRDIYFLAYIRHGFDFTGLERVDMPPNAGGFCYTEFRRPDGTVRAVVSTDLLVSMPTKGVVL